jgi:hypothetical protein
MHVDFSRSESAWIFGVEGVPRLTVHDHSDRQGRQRRWFVDGKFVCDLKTALAVINGDVTLEDAMAQADEQPKSPKKSLTAQIAEIDYELEQRKSVYGRIGGSSPKRQSELELHVENMRAVRATLAWLQSEEDFIRWAIANKDAIRQRMEG